MARSVVRTLSDRDFTSQEGTPVAIMVYLWGGPASKQRWWGRDDEVYSKKKTGTRGKGGFGYKD